MLGINKIKLWIKRQRKICYVCEHKRVVSSYGKNILSWYKYSRNYLSCKVCYYGKCK